MNSDKGALDQLMEGLKPADLLVMSRFSSGLFRAMFARKEVENGKEIYRRVSV